MICNICHKEFKESADKTRCKPCNAKRMREYRASNKDHYYKLIYANEKKHWHKHLARHQLKYRIKIGEIKKQPCQECGESKVQAHHSDYTKPLLVQWLCVTCHNNLHKIHA